jgi:hypothetical protein
VSSAIYCRIVWDAYRNGLYADIYLGEISFVPPNEQITAIIGRMAMILPSDFAGSHGDNAKINRKTHC